MVSPKMLSDAGPNAALAHIVEWVRAHMTRAFEPAPGAADVAQYAQLIYVDAGLQCVRLAAAIRKCVLSSLCGAATRDEKQSVLTQGLTRKLIQEIYGTGLPVRKLLRMVQKRFVRAPRVDPVTAVSWGLPQLHTGFFFLIKLRSWSSCDRIHSVPSLAYVRPGAVLVNRFSSGENRFSSGLTYIWR